MRPRALLEVREESPSLPRAADTYERVRRTLDEVLAELELPLEVLDADADRSAPHRL
jgi:hypothetical protein